MNRSPRPTTTAGHGADPDHAPHPDSIGTAPAGDTAHELIIASAGAGKTFTIASRFIGLLAADQPPDRIFASTFTRKAAGEILDRVLGRLAAACLDDVRAAELAESLPVGGASPDRGRWLEVLRRVVGHLHRLNIRTLDSFFVACASSFALELGLGPAWRIADDASDRRVRDEAIAALLAEDAEGEGGPGGDLVVLLRLVGGGGAERSVHERLLRMVHELHDLYLEAPQAQAWSWSARRVLGGRVLGPEELAAARQALCEAEAVLPRTQKGQGPVTKNYLKAYRGVMEAARREDWEGFLSETLVGRCAEPQPQYDRKAVPDALVRTVLTLREHARGVVGRAMAERCGAIHELLRRFHHHYRRLQRARGLYRFTDLTYLLGGPVAENRDGEPAADESDRRLIATDELYYRLDARVRHILLDEFQDTSLAQWRVLEPLVEELAAHRDGSRAAVVVADPKQAIYGWRGGEAALVRRVGQRYALPERTLERSWRSSRIVLEAVNAVFGDIASNAALAVEDREAARQWQQNFRPHEPARELSGYMRVATAPKAERGQKQWAATLDRAAEHVAELSARRPGSEIGVLMRTNKAVTWMIYRLRQCGVPASEEGGNPLTDSAPVSAVLSLLRLADHPGDKVARFHVAGTPLGAAVGLRRHDDDESARRLAREVRRSLLVEGYGPTLRRWAERLAGHCDWRDLNRLLQLVELGHRYEAQAGLRPGAFIAVVEATRVEDATPAAVRVMTVHQAKGLEFDEVVLGELDVPLVGRGRGGPRMLAEREGPAQRVRRIVPELRAELRPHFPELAAAHEQQRDRAVRDALSVLYVAMTRARHALHLVIAPDDKAPDEGIATFAKIVRAALRGDAPAGADEPRWLELGDADWPPPPPEVPQEAPPEATATQKAAVTVESGSSAAVEEGRPLRVALAESSGHRRLVRRTPSSLEGGRRVDLSMLMRLETAGALGFGSLVHRLFEQVLWLDDGAPDEQRLRAALGDVEPRRAAEAIDAFGRMAERPAVRAALSRSSYPADAAVEVLRERRFAVRLDETLLSGAFDRLVLVRDAGATGPTRSTVRQAELIDFKTDRLEDGDETGLAQRVAFYRPQVEAYRKAAARLYGLDPKRVRAKLVFVTAGEVAVV